MLFEWVVVYRHKRGYTVRRNTRYPGQTIMLLQLMGRELIAVQPKYLRGA